ncbi:MAG: IS3 family transposase [Mycobacteriales bacterium]
MFVDEHRARFGVEPICRELEVSARAYRQRRAAPPSARAQSDAVLLAEIRRIHSETDESYGAWRCWRQLRKDGFCVARCTVSELWSIAASRHASSLRVGGSVARTLAWVSRLPPP